MSDNVIEFPGPGAVRVTKYIEADGSPLYVVEEVEDSEMALGAYPTIADVKAALPQLVEPGTRIIWDVGDDDR